MATTNNPFKVGDWVKFRLGPKETIGRVIEARGPIGIHGRRLYRVQITRTFGDPDHFEMPEDQLQRAAAADIPK